MQTVIGIVICLIIGIYFLIGFMETYNGSGFMNTYEGLETKTTGSVGVGVPLTTAVENSAKAVATLKTIVPAVSNGDNKALYSQHIDNLLDYCDWTILDIINNATPDPSTGKYNGDALNQITHYAKIKDALNGSSAFLDLVD